MLRLRDRCLRGEPLVMRAPTGHWQTIALIHAIDRQGILAAFVLDGATNAAAFKTFVEKVLVPKLRDDEIIILDNLGPHKNSRAAVLIIPPEPRFAFSLCIRQTLTRSKISFSS